MHRLIQEHLEELLADYLSAKHPAVRHLAECGECREQVAAMRQQSAWLRRLRPPADDLEPRAGFYARVMERIEAQMPVSIWNVVFDSIAGRRIAMAAFALAVLMAVFLVTSEKSAEPQIADGVTIEMLGQPVATFVSDQDASFELACSHPNCPDLAVAPDQDSVLVDLVTYREQ
jgi:hypothetical protein